MSHSAEFLHQICLEFEVCHVICKRCPCLTCSIAPLPPPTFTLPSSSSSSPPPRLCKHTCPSGYRFKTKADPSPPLPPSSPPTPRLCKHTCPSGCRFVTKAEVDRLGLNHLIGTSLMRAYMHGFFVDNRLWHKARALAEPFAYDTYRQQRVQQKMDQERKSRISIVKKLPKVTHTLTVLLIPCI